MSKYADQIRLVALGPTPRQAPWALTSWLRPLSFFPTPFFEEAYDFDYGDDTERRMFLLFAAEYQQEIDDANAAAYHGDIDGDFDY